MNKLLKIMKIVINNNNSKNDENYLENISISPLQKELSLLKILILDISKAQVLEEE